MLLYHLSFSERQPRQLYPLRTFNTAYVAASMDLRKWYQPKILVSPKGEEYKQAKHVRAFGSYILLQINLVK